MGVRGLSTATVVTSMPCEGFKAQVEHVDLIAYMIA